MEKEELELWEKIKEYGEKKTEHLYMDVRYDMTLSECELIWRLRNMSYDNIEKLTTLIRQTYFKEKMDVELIPAKADEAYGKMLLKSLERRLEIRK